MASPFADSAAVAYDAAETPRKVPGLADLHRMTTLLLAEQAPGGARILVVGAGGGLELAVMAKARPEWRFMPIDNLDDLAGLLHPTASDFSALVSKIGRDVLFPQWQAMGGADALPPLQG